MKTNPWIHIADALPRSLVNQARPVANDERFHSGRPLFIRLHGWRAVDVFVGDVVPDGLGIGNQTFCSVRRNCLPSLVVPHISLCATHAASKRFLSDAELFSNRFNSAHLQIVAALLIFVNSAAVLPYETEALLLKHVK